MTGRKRSKRYFGSVRQLPSKRWQARYPCPRPECGQQHPVRSNDGKLFETAGDADAALAEIRTRINAGTWRPPCVPPDPAATKPPTVREYGDDWLTGRHLEESTRAHYQMLLETHIYPTFGDMPVPDVTPASVRTWHAHLARGDGKKTKDRPTVRAHAYSLLKTIMGTAVDDEIRDSNPCRVRGASYAKRARHIRPASVVELEMIVNAVPARYRLLIMLAAWGAFRFGELAEMRRSDVDAKNGIIRVRRGVARTKGKRHVKGPKCEAGKRDVNIPPQLTPMVRDHLRDHVAIRRDALLFPAAGDPNKHLAPSTMQAVFYPARDKAGRPDLRFHDLRHTGAVLAAATGATLAELMARLGHSSPRAAMRYQHAAADRDRVIAEALSKLATVIPIETARKEGIA